MQQAPASPLTGTQQMHWSHSSIAVEPQRLISVLEALQQPTTPCSIVNGLQTYLNHEIFTRTLRVAGMLTDIRCLSFCPVRLTTRSSLKRLDGSSRFLVRRLPYLCQLVFAAILSVKLLEMFPTLLSLECTFSITWAFLFS